MTYATKRGRPRQITDEQYQKIIEWKRLKDLAKEIGIPLRTAHMIREGYIFKKASP